MRVLGKVFADAFAGRWLNVHPALLPSFPGGHAVRDALDWVDHGPIVLQEAVAIRDDDDWDSLEVRIHEAEHRLLPRAVRALMDDRLTVQGRHVRIAEGET